MCKTSTGGLLEKTKMLKDVDEDINVINGAIFRSTQELEALAGLVPQTLDGNDGFKVNILFILRYRLNKNVKNFKALMALKNKTQMDILSRQTKSRDSITSSLRQRNATKKVIPGIDFNESSGCYDGGEGGSETTHGMDLTVDTPSARLQSQESLFYVERANKMRQIEKGMAKLQGVFSQMASLVYEQGEMLNRIDHNIDTSVLYVDDAHNRLYKQLKLLKNNRGQIIKIFAILIAVCVIYVKFFL